MSQDPKSESNFPSIGFVREKQIIGRGCPLPIGRSSWWEGIRTGKYPAPVKLGPRTTAWRVEDIRKLLEQVGASTNDSK
jgi:predicted DNA-binding transcriptional regulator AlpA